VIGESPFVEFPQLDLRQHHGLVAHLHSVGFEPSGVDLGFDLGGDGVGREGPIGGSVGDSEEKGEKPFRPFLFFAVHVRQGKELRLHGGKLGKQVLQVSIVDLIRQTVFHGIRVASPRNKVVVKVVMDDL